MSETEVNQPIQNESFKERLRTRVFPTTERRGMLTYASWIGQGGLLFGSMGVTIAIAVPLLTTFYGGEVGREAAPLLLDLAQKGAIVTGVGIGLFGAFSGYMVARNEVECDQSGRIFYPPFYD